MTHTIAGPGCRVTVSALGAEVTSVVGADGHEYLWQAGPEWPRNAPVLFPVIGRVEGDRLRSGGRVYPMPQHGFARDLQWEVLRTEPTLVDLRLASGPATERHLPHEFSLTATYEIVDGALAARFVVANPGDEALPYSIGLHPAFRWPLDDAPRSEHQVTFEHPEPRDVRRVHDVLLTPRPEPTPVQSATLVLDDGPFRDGAVILPDLASRRLVYASPTGRSVELAWSGFDTIAVWTPLTASLLCLEPWHGLPAPLGHTGEHRDQRGLRLLPPGETATYSVTMRFGGAAPVRPWHQDPGPASR